MAADPRLAGERILTPRGADALMEHRREFQEDGEASTTGPSDSLGSEPSEPSGSEPPSAETDAESAFLSKGRGSRRFVMASTLPKFMPRGRKGTSIRVIKRNSALQWFRDSYNWLLKVPNNIFILLLIACPVALAAVSTPFFLLFAGGFSSDLPSLASLSVDFAAQPPAVSRVPSLDRFFFDVLLSLTWTAKHLYFAVHVFFYALSICTSFNGSPLEAHSPRLLLLSNLLSAVSQLLFVFLSGAVFARLGRPAENIRSAGTAVVCDQPVAGHSEETQRLLLARFGLIGANHHELVNASLSLTLRLLVATSAGSVFSVSHALSLVHSEVPYFKFGFTLRHVIDDDSPLAGLTLQDLVDGDASLVLSVSAQERSSLQSVFHVREYFAADGEILWDHEFEDIVEISPTGEPHINQSRLDHVRPTI